MLDWVGVYTIVLYSLNMGIALASHGRKKVGNESIWTALIGLVFAIPIFGRVVGWW